MVASGPKGLLPNHKPMNKRLPLILLTVALVSAACSVAGPRTNTNRPAGTVAAPAATQTTAPSIAGVNGSDALNNFQSELESIAAAVVPSIVQTDTAQALGSGIVYDSAGDIVTNNHVVARASASGCAIPSVQVTAAARQIVTTGSVTHSGRPYLGVSTHDDQTSGADIVSVVSGGPAAKGGLQPGMVITAVGDHPVADTDGLSQALSAFKPGD